MRITKRTALHQAASGKLTGDGMQHRHIKRLSRRQRRQQPRQSGRKHRLAGTWRPDHEQVVAPGGRDFQNAACRFLSAQISEVGRALRRWQQFGPWWRQVLDTAKVVQQRHQIRRGDDRQVACPGRLGATARRANQITPGSDRRHGRRKHARNGFDRAVKRQFTKHHVAVDRVARHTANGDKKAKRDR